MKRIIWVMGICLILLIGTGMVTKAKAEPQQIDPTVQEFIQDRGAGVCGLLVYHAKDGLTGQDLGAIGHYLVLREGFSSWQASQALYYSAREWCPEWMSTITDITVGPVVQS